MECGKLTAKLRDAVPVCFIENGKEVKRFRNIEIPDEIKKLLFQDFEFSVPVTGAITFKIMFAEGILPEGLAGSADAQNAESQAGGSTHAGENHNRASGSIGAGRGRGPACGGNRQSNRAGCGDHYRAEWAGIDHHGPRAGDNGGGPST